MSARWTVLRRLLIALAFVAVLLQPGYGERESVTQVADVEVMVVIDRTRSMAALDHGDGEPRVRGVRQDLHELVETLPGTRFSLLTWGTDARLELPFTTDHTAFLDAVDTMRLEGAFDGSGTAIDTPLRELVTELKRAEEQYPDRRRKLLFISDGENTTESAPASYERVAKYIDGGLVLGYGTAKGAPMPLADDLSAADGMVQHDGGNAISKADHEALRTVAQQTGTEFVARTAPGGIPELTGGFVGAFVEAPDETVLIEHDLTWIAGLVLLGLLLWELHGHWRAVWSTPRALGRPSEEVAT